MIPAPSAAAAFAEPRSLKPEQPASISITTTHEAKKTNASHVGLTILTDKQDVMPVLRQLQCKEKQIEAKIEAEKRERGQYDTNAV